jgi:ribosomal protein S18 acetylase RimI-like enzyme
VRRSGEPFWYLGTLGVAPPFQGRGFGSALLTVWLREVDRESLPACLETDVRENVGFYARAGFREEEEISLLGIPVWCMRRPGRVCETPPRTGTP